MLSNNATNKVHIHETKYVNYLLQFSAETCRHVSISLGLWITFMHTVHETRNS
jgi:hypothetical protein